MSTSTQFTKVISFTTEAIKSVIPGTITADAPNLFTDSHYEFSMGVLIGFTGDIRGRLLIVGNHSTFANIGELMFGFQLNDEMLESFIGELGNMIAGNFCTLISNDGLLIDITPPTVLIGQTKISCNERAYILPISVGGKSELQFVITIEN